MTVNGSRQGVLRVGGVRRRWFFCLSHAGTQGSRPSCSSWSLRRFGSIVRPAERDIRHYVLRDSVFFGGGAEALHAGPHTYTYYIIILLPLPVAEQRRAGSTKHPAACTLLCRSRRFLPRFRTGREWHTPRHAPPASPRRERPACAQGTSRSTPHLSSAPSPERRPAPKSAT